MFGMEIPKNTKQAFEMDKNGNNQCCELIDKELKMINQFKTFHHLKKGEILAPKI